MIIHSNTLQEEPKTIQDLMMKNFFQNFAKDVQTLVVCAWFGKNVREYL